MKTALALAAALLLAGCNLVRLETEQQPVRYLSPDWSAVDTQPPADGSKGLRLMPVAARPNLRAELVRARADGEVVPDRLWRWTEAPDRYVAVILGARLAKAGFAVREDPDHAALRLSVLDCLVDEAAGELRLSAHVRLVGTDAGVREAVVQVARPWNKELPGDLAQAMGGAVVELADRAAGLAGRWTAGK